MIDIRLTKSMRDNEPLETVASRLNGKMQPVRSRAGVEAVRLLLTDRRLPEPFRVYPDRGVVVSMWDSERVCKYTGISLEKYLLVASLLGLMQWRVLKRNPLLRLDDLHHPQNVRCVFANPQNVQEFALLLDPPVICPGCVDFYHCLGADSELIALRQAIAESGRAVTPARS